MRREIDKLTANLRSLMSNVEDSPLTPSERYDIEEAYAYMSQAVQAFEEFRKYMWETGKSLERGRLGYTQKFVVGVCGEGNRTKESLDDAKRKLADLADN